MKDGKDEGLPGDSLVNAVAERAGIYAVSTVTRPEIGPDEMTARQYAPRVINVEDPLVRDTINLAEQLSSLSASDTARSAAVQEALRKIGEVEAEFRKRWDAEMKIIEEALQRIADLRVSHD